MTWLLILIAFVLVAAGALAVFTIFVRDSLREVGKIAEELGEPPRRWQIIALPFAGTWWAPPAVRLLIRGKNRWRSTSVKRTSTDKN